MKFRPQWIDYHAEASMLMLLRAEDDESQPAPATTTEEGEALIWIQNVDSDTSDHATLAKKDDNGRTLEQSAMMETDQDTTSTSDKKKQPEEESQRNDGDNADESIPNIMEVHTQP
jgi:hypothetical protein